MTVQELMEALGAPNTVEGADLTAKITCGYTCDLLSWVLAHGKQGMAWVTMQTHVNVIAVAVLMEMACVILSEGVVLEEAAMSKAREEGIAVLTSDKTAYELAGMMMQIGVQPPEE